MDIDDIFIQTRSGEIWLKNNMPVVLRPVVAEDRSCLEQGLETLSFKSRYLRFLRPKKRLTEQELEYLTEIDYVNHFAWVAATPQLKDIPGIGVARYVHLPDQPGTAEIAIVVTDAYQGLGLGTILLWLLAETAQRSGIACFTGYLLPENRIMLDILNRFGADQQRSGTAIEISVDLPLSAEALNNPGLVEKLRRIAAGRSRNGQVAVDRLSRQAAVIDGSDHQ